MRDMVEVRRQLVEWLQNQVGEARAEGVVFGLSGGLDSAVVAAICQEAFPEDTLAVIMPCFSDEEDVHHAQLVADTFGVRYRIVNLNDSFTTLVKELVSHLEGQESLSLAKNNIKPRLRMMALYFYAAQYNYLVVGTTNKSELEVGYFTKHGDGGVDLQLLGGLVKTEVWDLAAQLGVPQIIIDKVPSGGLWPGQTDEQELGLSYTQLDGYLMGQEVSRATRERMEQLQNKSAHKRQLPVVPKL